LIDCQLLLTLARLGDLVSFMITSVHLLRGGSVLKIVQ